MHFHQGYVPIDREFSTRSSILHTSNRNVSTDTIFQSLVRSTHTHTHCVERCCRQSFRHEADIRVRASTRIPEMFRRHVMPPDTFPYQISQIKDARLRSAPATSVSHPDCSGPCATRIHRIATLLCYTLFILLFIGGQNLGDYLYYAYYHSECAELLDWRCQVTLGRKTGDTVFIALDVKRARAHKKRTASFIHCVVLMCSHAMRYLRLSSLVIRFYFVSLSV